MHTSITTTLTNRLDLDTFTPNVHVDINVEDDLPMDLVYAAVVGSLKATLGTLHDTHPEKVETAVRAMCDQFGIRLVGNAGSDSHMGDGPADD